MTLRRVSLVVVFFLCCLSAYSVDPRPGPQSAAPVKTPAEECKVDDALQSNDLSKLQAANACVDARTARDNAAAEEKKLHDKEVAKAKLELTKKTKAKSKTANPYDEFIQRYATAPVRAGSPGGPEPPVAKPKDAAPPSPAAPAAAGTVVKQSAYATTSGCATSALRGDTQAQSLNGLLSVHRQLLRPQDVSDDFGRRLGRRFLVYQVTVTNTSKDFQYEISDISVDLNEVFKKIGAPHFSNADLANGGTKTLKNGMTASASYARVLASGQDLEMLRGVPEKGQDYDPRNMTLHILQGIGSVGAGVSGLTPFSDVMGSATANFNGAFLQGFAGVFPDHTANQLNRLSDRAFAANTLIERLQTKVFAIFIPESFVLPKYLQDDTGWKFWSRGSKGTFWGNPRALLNWLPLDQVNVCVDGVLLVQADMTPDPSFSTDTLSAVGVLNPVNVTDGTKVTISDAGASPTIYFSTDETIPTDKSPTFDPKSPIQIQKGKGDVTVKAFAVSAGKAPSNVVTTTFHAAEAAPKPTSVDVDKTTKTTVVIAPGNANDTVYYTTDGSTPSPASASTSVYKVGTPIPLPTDGTSITVTAVEVGNNTAFSPATTGGPFTAPK